MYELLLELELMSIFKGHTSDDGENDETSQHAQPPPPPQHGQPAQEQQQGGNDDSDSSSDSEYSDGQGIEARMVVIR